MSQPLIGPTVAQLQQIIAYLKTLPPEIAQRGSALVNGKAVTRLWWRTGGILMAKVQGSHLYTQSIKFGKRGITLADCTCPYYEDCKHTAAVLITFSKGWSGDGPDLENEDDDYDESDDEDFYGEDEDDENEVPDQPHVPSRVIPRLPSGKSPSLPKSKPASAVPSPSPAPETLAQVLAVKFCRKLTPSEQKRTALIDQLYRNRTPKITSDVLLTIAGQARSYYSYDPPIQIWPDHRPPANVAEAWLYLAHALKKYPHISPGPLFTQVPWPEVERLMAPWLREEAILEWQQKLTRFNQTPDTLPPIPPAFRLRLTTEGAQIEWRTAPGTPWSPIKITALRQHAKAAWGLYPGHDNITLDADAQHFLRTACPSDTYITKAFLEKNTDAFIHALNRLLRSPSPHAVAAPDGNALTAFSEPAYWTLDGPRFPVTDAPAADAESPAAALTGDYTLALRHADGTPLPGVLAILPGHPNLVLTLLGTWPLPGPLHPGGLLSPGAIIPVAAVESPAGLATLDRLRIPLPPRVSRRVRTVPLRIRVRCALEMNWNIEVFKVQATSTSDGLFPDETWQNGAWKPAFPHHSATPSVLPAADTLTRLDRALQFPVHDWLNLARLSPPYQISADNYWMERRLSKAAAATFPDEFLAWLDQRPEGITVELDPDLAALRDKGKVTGNFNLDVEESGIDWFDLSLNLQLSDIELTQKEINLLLKNTGAWVRLPGRGWRRLDFDITDETQQQLADLGLSPADLHATEKQRLHVFQLAHPSASGLLPGETAAQVQRRAADLRTAVSPALPAGITAALRPYQLEGFHFLAYLSTNRFGGILADDMGLGKTLQALTWLAWLHETAQLDNKPILVVCPKSVQDNWTSEAAKFYPALPVRQWTSATSGDLDSLTAAAPASGKKSSRKKAALPADPATDTPPPLLLIINYTQLRLHADALAAIHWSAVILDEAQYIKNPSSLTAKTAFGLTARHRLALSGTPIENRLLDLWSIMAFAMPGILGNRAAFAKNFDARDDPHARRRLGARVRPFLLRRTKKEVAADLPDRIEEDLICTLEGPQQEHYLAELKHARSTLLKAKTSSQLDKLRFNILTSLLRLRQICCHPGLTGKGARDAESAKLNTLLELLEPLIDEGHKVLIFSQFVEMLHLIGTALTERTWPHLLLTGATEDRGALVQQFQESEGANCFLISLKAGGSGLNLTAASYVVLFDPWWNPAVENQAIDRTHRIGQVNKVIAYRLITKDTIEEKIRALQKTKSELAGDILGEETFAKALTLDDFQFLLGG